MVNNKLSKNDSFTHYNNNVSLQEITGFNKLKALTCNLFRGELLNILGISPERMQCFVDCAASFPIYEITRPAKTDTKDTILQLIINKLEA